MSPALHYTVLPALQRPLLDKFYRAHRSSMRTGNDDVLWVARHAGIVAGLCLKPLTDGHWLTGLFVAPQERHQAVGSNLVRQALSQTPGQVWLFCHPDLADFYRRLDFQPCTHLPESLADRLVRYSRTKPLLSLYRPSAAV